MILRRDGKWRVYQGDITLRWLVVRGVDIGRLRHFPTHAEALAYAIEQAEAER